LTTNNALLSKINETDLRLAHRKGSWKFEVLSALYEIPGADVHISAITSCPKINTSDFELLLREQTIREWRSLETWTRFIHMMHTFPAETLLQSHENISHPVLSAHRESDWLVGRSETHNQTNSSFVHCGIRQNIPNHLSRALSSRRLSGHSLNIERLRRE